MRSLNSRLTRDALFDALRKSMREYAWREKLGDFGAVASDMEQWGDSSWDPAYKADFDKLMPDRQYQLGRALVLSAQYIRLAVGFGVAGADEFADALDRASDSESYRPLFLASFFRPIIRKAPTSAEARGGST